MDGYGGGGYYTVHSLGSVHPQGGDKYVIGGAMMGDSSGGGGSYALDYYAAYGMLGPLGVGPDGQVWTRGRLGTEDNERGWGVSPRPLWPLGLHICCPARAFGAQATAWPCPHRICGRACI